MLNSLLNLSLKLLIGSLFHTNTVGYFNADNSHPFTIFPNFLHLDVAGDTLYPKQRSSTFASHFGLTTFLAILAAPFLLLSQPAFTFHDLGWQEPSTARLARYSTF